MNLLSNIKIIFSLSILLTSLLAFGQANPQLKVATGEWRPFHSEAYQHQGAATHIIRLAAEKAGIDVSFGFFPWKRAYSLAQLADQWDATGVWGDKEERREFFLFSDPIVVIDDVLFVHIERPIKWDSMEDMKNISIAAVRGYQPWIGFQKQLDAGELNVSLVNDDVTGIRMLSVGRVDAFPVAKEVGYEILYTQVPDLVDFIVPHEKPFSSTSYHLLFSKASPTAVDLLMKFNKGLDAIKKSGDYDKIMKNLRTGKYLPDPKE